LSLAARRSNCVGGGGFNAHFFYSIRVGSMLSVDFDPKAIAYARRNFTAENVRYELADIRTQMPEGIFDNIVWDAAIEHFTEAEIDQLMGNIKKRLTPTGTLSGFTIAEKTDGKKMLPHHEYEFKSKEDLARFFRPHFKNVKVFETIYPDRHNLYFWASDGILPFMVDGRRRRTDKPGFHQASRLGEVRQTLMAGRAATPRVSNHEATGASLNSLAV